MADEDDGMHGRLHWFLPEELDAEQQAFYDELISGPRGRGPLDERGRLKGAFNSRLLDPAVGNAIQKLGAAVRFESKIPAREREIAMMEVCRFDRNNAEWHGHANHGRDAGLTDEDVEAIRTGQDSPTLTDADRLVRKVTQTILNERDLSDEQFKEAEEGLGLVKLFDIISIVGHYQHTGLAFRIWRIPLSKDIVPAFPD